MNRASLISVFAVAGLGLCLQTGCATPGLKRTGAPSASSSAHCTAASCPNTAPATAPPGGEAELAAPAADRERSYLGLAGGAADFALSDVRADVLIVDLFDLYCHVCQKTAPKVNALFTLLERRGHGGRIKMIGVAVGDTPLEAETFRRKFQVPFPVFADRAKAVSAEFGNEKRPCLLVLKKHEGRLSVIFSHTGSIDDIDATLEAILKAAGL